MARKPQTAEQIAARVAKMKATKAAKKAAALEQIGAKTTKPKKVRTKRTMTAAQKAAAAERLQKAREAKGPSTNSTIDETVRNLPSDDLFSLTNVRQWIKTNKQLLQAMRDFKNSKDSSERARYTDIETYVANLEAYLRTGVYLDHRYGEERQSKVKMVSVAMSYYPDGTPKRSAGVWYSDIGVYTDEMAQRDHEQRREAISNKSKIRKAG